MAKQESKMVRALRKHLESLTEEEKEQMRKEFEEEAKNSVGPTAEEYLRFLEKTLPPDTPNAGLGIEESV